MHVTLRALRSFEDNLRMLHKALLVSDSWSVEDTHEQLLLYNFLLVSNN